MENFVQTPQYLIWDMGVFGNETQHDDAQHLASQQVVESWCCKYVFQVFESLGRFSIGNRFGEIGANVPKIFLKRLLNNLLETMFEKNRTLTNCVVPSQTHRLVDTINGIGVEADLEFGE